MLSASLLRAASPAVRLASRGMAARPVRGWGEEMGSPLPDPARLMKRSIATDIFLPRGELDPKGAMISFGEPNAPLKGTSFVAAEFKSRIGGRQTIFSRKSAAHPARVMKRSFATDTFLPHGDLESMDAKILFDEPNGMSMRTTAAEFKSQVGGRQTIFSRKSAVQRLADQKRRADNYH